MAIVAFIIMTIKICSIIASNTFRCKILAFFAKKLKLCLFKEYQEESHMAHSA